jgi:hypothetical protein
MDFCPMGGGFVPCISSQGFVKEKEGKNIKCARPK